MKLLELFFISKYWRTFAHRSGRATILIVMLTGSAMEGTPGRGDFCNTQFFYTMILSQMQDGGHGTALKSGDESGDVVMIA